MGSQTLPARSPPKEALNASAMAALLRRRRLAANTQCSDAPIPYPTSAKYPNMLCIGLHTRSRAREFWEYTVFGRLDP